MIQPSSLYSGRVMHKRVRPKAHRLSYRCFWMLWDLDELAAIDTRLRLFSHNRFNVFSLYDRDHGDGRHESLRGQVERHLIDAGLAHACRRILLLAMPRVLGFGFNPLSIYFCYGSDDRLVALIYEVHNTFRQRHSYLIAVRPASGAEVTQHCDKRFYVSPFLEMDLAYAFRVTGPSETVSVAVRASDGDGPVLLASLAARASPLCDSALARAFLTFPFNTLKVVAAIHWEALRLWWKGVRLVPRPPPPAFPVTAKTFATPVGDSHD